MKLFETIMESRFYKSAKELKRHWDHVMGFSFELAHTVGGGVEKWATKGERTTGCG